jgi:2,4-dienoyl-CoA reductase-like NADH-dependent reductase (Old Yellow Enzyme family)
MEAQHAVLFEPIRIGPVTAPNRFVMMPYANGHSYLMPNGAIGIRETHVAMPTSLPSSPMHGAGWLN